MIHKYRVRRLDDNTIIASEEIINGLWYYDFYNEHGTNRGVLDTIELNYKGVQREQFTGLTDKNGVEIYESDVCIFQIDATEKTIDVVKFIDGGFNISNPRKDGWRIMPLWYPLSIEVIGNRFENPELLEGL